MNKKNVRNMFFVIIMIAAIVSVSFFGSVKAAVSFQEINGYLGGAEYFLRIPSNWNGGLVVYCRGYSHVEVTHDALNTQGSRLNPLLDFGYAVAFSSYGAWGYVIKEGIIRTHQLTEYVIDNFHVTGRVYLVGVSMGGNTVLELGVKYPHLYSGVLDISGTKDVISRYNLHSYYAGITDDTALGAAVVANGGLNPPYPTTSISSFRTYCTNSAADVIDQCKGTPDKKQQFYERISPIYSAIDISIPTITVHGTADGLAPYAQSVAYMNAITAAGHSDLYRLYKVVGGQHANPAVLNQITPCFQQLVNWVENGVVPPASNP